MYCMARSTCPAPAQPQPCAAAASAAMLRVVPCRAAVTLHFLPNDFLTPLRPVLRKVCVCAGGGGTCAAAGAVVHH